MKQKWWIAAAAVLFAAAAAFGPYHEAEAVHIIAAGDILLGRGVGIYTDKYGYDYPYSDIKDEILKGDIAIANLECPLTDNENPVFKRPDLIFRGSRLNGTALKNAGFDILNLANNHTMDQNREGLTDTIEVLESSGILAVGAGSSRSEARRPVFVKKGRTRIGFLGYCDFPPEGYIYSEEKADVARVDPEALSEEVKAAGKQCDFLVVSFHWGKEFDRYPGKRQREMAHTAIDSGAGLVLGHHPHVLQSVEKYKGKLIFYSLGNFVFDRQLPEGTDESVLVDIAVNKDEWKCARIIPVRIEACRPVVMQGEAAGLILGEYKAASEAYGTDIDIKQDCGYINP